MKKAISVGLVIVMLLLVFSGCSKKDTSTFDAYLLPGESDPNIMKEDTPVWTESNNTNNAPTPSETKEVRYQDALHELTYNKGLSVDWNIYNSADGKITCWFDKQTGKLRMISAENWFDLRNSEDLEQDLFTKWIKTAVSEYYTEDWSAYTLSCQTTITDNYTGTPVISIKNGFHAPYDKYEVVTAYTFKFTKYMGNHATADAIQAYIRMDTGFVALEFSGHAFDGIETIEIDSNKLTRSINQFVTTHINTGKYSYQKYWLRDQRLAYLNGKLCYLTTVIVEVLTIKDEIDLENLEAVYNIVLPLE